jgi:hypothetical protein
MSEFKKLPEDLQSLISFDRECAEYAQLLLSEIEEKNKSTDLVREIIMIRAYRTKVQDIIHAIFQQNMSIVLKRCGLNKLAIEWQVEALEVFCKDERFIDKSSLLAYRLSESYFNSKKFTLAQKWSNRSIQEAEKTGKNFPWLADAWRISAETLTGDKLGTEVESRLKKSLKLWSEQRSPDAYCYMLALMALGSYFYEVGKLTEAEEVYTDAYAYAYGTLGKHSDMAVSAKQKLNTVQNRRRG